MSCVLTSQCGVARGSCIRHVIGVIHPPAFFNTPPWFSPPPLGSGLSGSPGLSALSRPLVSASPGSWCLALWCGWCYSWQSQRQSQQQSQRQSPWQSQRQPRTFPGAPVRGRCRFLAASAGSVLLQRRVRGNAGLPGSSAQAGARCGSPLPEAHTEVLPGLCHGL